MFYTDGFPYTDINVCFPHIIYINNNNNNNNNNKKKKKNQSHGLQKRLGMNRRHCTCKEMNKSISIKKVERNQASSDCVHVARAIFFGICIFGSESEMKQNAKITENTFRCLNQSFSMSKGCRGILTFVKFASHLKDSEEFFVHLGQVTLRI